VFLPYKLKVSDISLESVKYIIVWQIVQIELLQDDKNEKINHDVLLNDYENKVEDGGPGGATVDTWNAIIFNVHTIEHNHGPVLSSR
jgi:hypothetical protein